MKERPVLFDGRMVRAILEGRKTQTRRVVKPQPSGVHHCSDRDSFPADAEFRDGHGIVHYTLGEQECFKCPFGRPGDRLWVRETFFHVAPHKGRPLFAAVDSDFDQGQAPADATPNTVE